MPQRKSASTDAIWAEAFKRALVKNVKEPEGPGWLTFPQFRKATGLGDSKGGRFINSEIKVGRMEAFRGSQIAANGRVCPQLWYRPIVALAVAMLMAGTACASTLRAHPTRPVPAPPPIKIVDETFQRPPDCSRFHIIMEGTSRQDAIEAAEQAADDMTICYNLLSMHTAFSSESGDWVCELVVDIRVKNIGSAIHVLM